MPSSCVPTPVSDLLGGTPADVSARPLLTTPQLDQAELDWWEQHAEVEDRFCWVQTPAIQRFLRGRYLRRILSGSSPGVRVLEIGCGSGWLCLLLARYGVGSVHGVDPSAAQLERARATAHQAGLADRVCFFQGVLPETDEWGEAARAYDVLILHAVLHHLSRGEINDLLRTFSEGLARPGARVFILEPIRFRSDRTHRSFWDHLTDRLILLPRMGKRLGIRRMGAEEAALSRRIDSRGDSPKEAPFQPGELEQLVAPYLLVERAVPVLSFSYLGAKNALLMQLSHPVLGRLLIWPYLYVLRGLEQYLLRLQPDTVWLPLFVLFECRLRSRD